MELRHETELQEIAQKLKYGYVFYQMESGQVPLPEQIIFNFVCANRQEFIFVVSHFIDLKPSTEKMRSLGYGEFMNPFDQKIKGLEDDWSQPYVRFDPMFFYTRSYPRSFSIVILGADQQRIKYPENLETALKIEEMIEKYALEKYISHEIGEHPDVVRKYNIKADVQKYKS